MTYDRHVHVDILVILRLNVFLELWWPQHKPALEAKLLFSDCLIVVFKVDGSLGLLSMRTLSYFCDLQICPRHRVRVQLFRTNKIVTRVRKLVDGSNLVTCRPVLFTMRIAEDLAINSTISKAKRWYSLSNLKVIQP